MTKVDRADLPVGEGKTIAESYLWKDESMIELIGKADGVLQDSLALLRTPSLDLLNDNHQSDSQERASLLVLPLTPKVSHKKILRKEEASREKKFGTPKCAKVRKLELQLQVD